MEFNFDKYQGAGNDFVVVDDRDQKFPQDNVTLIKRLCDRHIGIGADGLILVRHAEEADFKMLYFNADGHPSSLCGNGGRCVFAFARRLNIVKDEGVFEAIDGLHHAAMVKENIVCLNMNDVAQINKNGSALFLDTGSPHHLELVDDVSKINVKEQGAQIRYGAPYFDSGANVNFIQKINSAIFKIRTYERGVEGETLACGTGAVASAIGVHYLGLTEDTSILIEAEGGDLSVEFNENLGNYSDIKLIGPAELVFSGNFKVA